MTMRHDALLLDLDGTLLDTAPDMGGALNRLRLEHGREPLPAASIRPVVSHGAVRLVALGFPEATGHEFERLRLRFLELYAAHLSEGTRLFPGFEAVLGDARGPRRALGHRHEQAGLAHATRCSRRSASAAGQPAP